MIQAIKANHLTSAEWQLWSTIQRENPTLASPFFSPEFTRAVAAVRCNVEVAILRQQNEIVGFLPYERGPDNVARPVGTILSDYQGLIARNGVTADPLAILRAAGLTTWNFDHLLMTQGSFAPHCRRLSESYYLDLSEGFETYRRARAKAGSDEIRRMKQKTRKLAREVGDLQLHVNAKSVQVFEQLVTWKAAQYRRTGVNNLFSRPWVAELLKHVLRTKTESFEGTLASLYAGPHLMAIHLGMTSQDVLHSWFMAYNPAFARYSPGLILLVQLAETAQSRGIRLIDLGKGPEPYKKCYASGTIPLAEGFVDCRPFCRTLRTSCENVLDWVRSTPVSGAARRIKRFAQPIHEWLAS